MQQRLLVKIDLPHIQDFHLETVPSPLSGDYYGSIKVNETRWHIQYAPEDDLWWVNPRPSAEFYESLYTRYFYESPMPEQFGYPSLELDNERRTEKARLNWNDIERNVSIASKHAILELGCATGEFLVEAKNRGWEHAVGVEIGDEVVDEARKKNIKVLSGFFTALDLSGQTFDMIFADNVIEHVFNPIEDISKCHALQQEGGLLILRLPDTPPEGPALKLIDHTFHFTRKSITRLLEHCKYELLSIFYSGTYYGSSYAERKNPTQRIDNMTVIAKAKLH